MQVDFVELLGKSVHHGPCNVCMIICSSLVVYRSPKGQGHCIIACSGEFFNGRGAPLPFFSGSAPEEGVFDNILEVASNM